MQTAIVINPDSIHHIVPPGHPERPERYTAIIHAMKKGGLMEQANTLIARSAKTDELELCHPLKYIELVDKETQKCREMRVLADLSTGDVVIGPASFEVAKRAAGAVLDGVDAVMTGRFKRAFCVVRPPGHHACTDVGMGFCLFNNIAIGARYAQKHYGIKKVLIVDWDVHHGNGTQEIFEEDQSVFYFSTHEWPLYPGTGAADDTGKGKAQGTKLNVPIHSDERSREQILHAFSETLPQKMEQFKPDLVMISAGFDAHKDDLLGHLNLTTNDFATLTKLVCDIANTYSKGKVVSVLEGGYNLQALADSAVAHVKALE
jgi:acetoin utilization deacetylase AcuC-like enzyme